MTDPLFGIMTRIVGVQWGSEIGVLLGSVATTISPTPPVVMNVTGANVALCTPALVTDTSSAPLVTLPVGGSGPVAQLITKYNNWRATIHDTNQFGFGVFGFTMSKYPDPISVALQGPNLGEQGQDNVEGDVVAFVLKGGVSDFAWFKGSVKTATGGFAFGTFLMVTFKDGTVLYFTTSAGALPSFTFPKDKLLTLPVGTSTISKNGAVPALSATLTRTGCVSGGANGLVTSYKAAALV